MMENEVVEQVADNTSYLLALQNFGAGLVALALIFGGLVYLVKFIIPAINKIGISITDAIKTLGEIVNTLDKTVQVFQNNSNDNFHELSLSLLSLHNKLDYHCVTAKDIQVTINNTATTLAEVKANTRGLKKEGAEK